MNKNILEAVFSILLYLMAILMIVKLPIDNYWYESDVSDHIIDITNKHRVVEVQNDVFYNDQKIINQLDNFKAGLRLV